MIFDLSCGETGEIFLKFATDETEGLPNSKTQNKIIYRYRYTVQCPC
jgi:hypothetical protein